MTPSNDSTLIINQSVKTPESGRITNDPYKNIAILERVGSDVIIREHAIAYGYVIISQTVDNDTEYIMINSNEIEDLIDVLQKFKEMVALSKIGA